MLKEKQLHLIIATPLRTVYDDYINQLTVTTTLGEITILPRHVPLISSLEIGKAVIKKGNDKTYHTIDGGILEVRHSNEVIILSNRSENVEELDEQRAQEALACAQKIMQRKHSDEDIDYARVERNITKELNRIKLSQKGRR